MVLLAYRGTPGLCAVRKRGGRKGGKEGVRREREQRKEGGKERERRR